MRCFIFLDWETTTRGSGMCKLVRLLQKAQQRCRNGRMGWVAFSRDHRSCLPASSLIRSSVHSSKIRGFPRFPHANPLCFLFGTNFPGFTAQPAIRRPFATITATSTITKHQHHHHKLSLSRVVENRVYPLHPRKDLNNQHACNESNVPAWPQICDELGVRL